VLIYMDTVLKWVYVRVYVKQLFDKRITTLIHFYSCATQLEKKRAMTKGGATITGRIVVGRWDFLETERLFRVGQSLCPIFSNKKKSICPTCSCPMNETDQDMITSSAAKTPVTVTVADHVYTCGPCTAVLARSYCRYPLETPFSQKVTRQINLSLLSSLVIN